MLDFWSKWKKNIFFLRRTNRVYYEANKQVYAAADRSIIGILGGLFESFVGDHVVLDGGQEIFEGGGFFPVFEKGQVIYSSVALVDAGQVAFIIELEDGRDLGVAGTALDVQTVDPVLEVGLGGRLLTL